MASFSNLKLDHVNAPTGLLPREGDGYFQGKVLVHLTSLVLCIALIAQAGSEAASNGVSGDQAALIFSLLLLICGVVSIVGVSVSSTRPFSQHGIVHSLAIWAQLKPVDTTTSGSTARPPLAHPWTSALPLFVGAFTCLIYSFVGTYSALANDHNARVLGLFAAMSQSLGISTLMSAFITGVAASNAPYDERPTNA